MSAEMRVWTRMPSTLEMARTASRLLPSLGYAWRGFYSVPGPTWGLPMVQVGRRYDTHKGAAIRHLLTSLPKTVAPDDRGRRCEYLYKSELVKIRYLLLLLIMTLRVTATQILRISSRDPHSLGSEYLGPGAEAGWKQGMSWSSTIPRTLLHSAANNAR